MVVKRKGAAEIFGTERCIVGYFHGRKKKLLCDQNKMCLFDYVRDIFGKLN